MKHWRNFVLLLFEEVVPSLLRYPKIVPYSSSASSLYIRTRIMGGTYHGWRYWSNLLIDASGGKSYLDSSLRTFRFENGSIALIFLYFLTLPIAAVEYPDRSLIMWSMDGLPHKATSGPVSKGPGWRRKKTIDELIDFRTKAAASQQRRRRLLWFGFVTPVANSNALPPLFRYSTGGSFIH